MSLHIIGPGSITLMKNQPQVIEFTKVNGKEAVWAVGPYLIGMKNGDTDIQAHGGRKCADLVCG